MADDDTLAGRDERDQQIGSLLDVEPLDELTRRRLVSTALDAAAPAPAARTRRWLAAAAVLLVVIGGGGALLATAGGGRNDQPTAAPVLTPAQKNDGLGATPKAAPASPGLPQTDSQSREAVPSPALAFTGPPVDVGDFGDLTRRANVERLRAAVEPSALAAVGSDPGRGEQLSTTLATRTCVANLPPGTVFALATGHYGKRSAIVVVANLPSGERSIDVVITHPCEVRPL